MTFTEREYRDVIGHFATGVSVMTTVDGDVPHGMTANSVASVSLDPVLTLVCVERTTVMYELIARTGVFALSFLRAEQETIARHFADGSRPSGAPQFEGITHTTAATGSPIIDGAIGYLDCELWAAYDGGDHLIVCGEVVALGRGADAEPLLYYGSRYRALPIT